MFYLADLGVTWEKAELSNGIPVHFFMKKGSPVTFFIVFPVGSTSDPEGKKGITHFLEHAIYKSEEGGRDLGTRIEEMGGHLNGYTSNDEVAFHAQIGDFGDFDELVGLFAGAFLDYKVSSGVIDTERGVIIQELQNDYADPKDMLGGILEPKAMFAGTQYENPVIGTAENLHATSDKDLEDMLKTVLSYQPIILVTGDFDSDPALNSLEKHFKLDNNLMPVRPKKLTFGKLKNLTHKMDVDFINASMGFRGCEIFHDDSLGLDFLSTALGSGALSTILMKRIRKELGLVYFIYTHFDALVNAGALMVTFGTEKQNLKRVYKEIKEIMKRIVETGLTDGELKFTKQLILKSTKIRYEKVLPVALEHRVGELFNPDNYYTLEKYLNAVEKITNKDLVGIAQKYLSPDEANYMAVGNVEISDLV